MKLFGKVTKIQGREITLSLDKTMDIRRMQTLADGSQPLIEVNVSDAREIRVDQRKMAYALLREIDDFFGYPSGWAKEKSKFEFEYETGIEFSLSNTSVEIATLYLKYLIAFMFQENVPFSNGYEPITETINWQMYCAIRTRQCAVCRKPHSDIHHAVGFVGMGNNRKNVNHLKSKYICLCRDHHNEIHWRGLTEFMKLHHVSPIKLKADTLVRLGLMTKNQIKELNGGE